MERIAKRPLPRPLRQSEGRNAETTDRLPCSDRGEQDLLVVRSGLSGFVLLDEILETGPDAIAGRKRFNRSALYLGIEALAQLGAFHVRYLADFEKHAFLLAVKRCSLPAAPELTGTFRLEGKLESRSSRAFYYRLRASGENGVEMEGEFLFALAQYGGAGLDGNILRAHYKKVFSCLRSGYWKDC